MSDQRVVTDWKAYFESLGPGTPSPHSRDFSDPHEGFGKGSVTFSRKDCSLDRRELPEGVELFDFALEVWEANGRPEMWVACNVSGPSWHVDGVPGRPRMP